jgi:MFS family permease
LKNHIEGFRGERGSRQLSDDRIIAGRGGSTSRSYGTIAVVAGTFISVLNTTVINVPLGQIARDLRVSVVDASLIITATLITYAMFLPLGDWLGARFGRRNVYCAAVAVLGITSLICSLANSLPSLIAMRIVQGMASAAVVPSVMTILAALYLPAERPRALSAWATANSAGQAVGPPLGGLLTAMVGWRFVFLPTPVIAALAVAAAVRYLPYDAPVPKVLEWRGATVLVFAALLLLSSVAAIPQLGVASPIVIGAAAAGIVCTAAFVFAIKHAGRPFVSPLAFAERSYRTSCIGVTGATIVLGLSLVALPLYLTQALGVSVEVAGFISLSQPLAMAILAPVTSRIVLLHGSGRTIQFGLLALFFGSFAIVALIALHAGAVAFVPALIIIGGALAVQYTAGAVGTTTSVAGRVGAGIGLFNLLRIAGFAVGAALVAIALHYDSTAYGTIFLIAPGIVLVALICTALSERRSARAE